MKIDLQNLLPKPLREVRIARDSLPVTRDDKLLPYEGLDFGQFELFCCELVNRNLENEGPNTKIIRIEPLANDGQSQYGADIFIEKNRNGETWIELIEVKRVKGFNKTVYETALKRLEKNLPNWNYKVRKFTVISSESLSADVINTLKNHSVPNLSPDIELDIWSSSHLDRIIEGNESLVFKYFHPIWVGMLFGVKTQEHFEKYGIYEFNEPASWINYEKPSETEFLDSIVIQNDHVKIYGFLPTFRSDTSSCQVELRNGRFSHVIMTLNQRELVSTYFQGARSPLEANERRFLSKNSFERSMWICDIGNCRITLTEEEAVSICNAFDQFSIAYEKRLLERENVYRAGAFSALPGLGAGVALMKIKRGLWGILRDFADAHDALTTDTKWSIFESSGRGFLKILTTKKNEKYDVGFHVFIKPCQVQHFFQSFLQPDDDVLLVWIPPMEIGLNQHEGRIGPRYYWDATTTFDWLTRECIPYALYWKKNETYKNDGLFKRLFSKNPNFKEHVKSFDISKYIHSYREIDIKENEKITTADQLCSLAQRLQSFYHSRHKGVFLSSTDYRALFEALGTVMKFSEIKNVQYLRGNLGYLVDVTDAESLISAVVEHAKVHDKYCTNSFRIDCVLRCFEVILNSKTCILNAVELQGVAKKLEPLVSQMCRIELLERQSVRLASVD